MGPAQPRGPSRCFLLFSHNQTIVVAPHLFLLRATPALAADIPLPVMSCSLYPSRPPSESPAPNLCARARNRDPQKMIPVPQFAKIVAFAVTGKRGSLIVHRSCNLWRVAASGSRVEEDTDDVNFVIDDVILDTLPLRPGRVIVPAFFSFRLTSNSKVSFLQNAYSLPTSSSQGFTFFPILIQPKGPLTTSPTPRPPGEDVLPKGPPTPYKNRESPTPKLSHSRRLTSELSKRGARGLRPSSVHDGHLTWTSLHTPGLLRLRSGMGPAARPVVRGVVLSHQLQREAHIRAPAPGDLQPAVQEPGAGKRRAFGGHFARGEGQLVERGRGAVLLLDVRWWWGYRWM